MGNIKNCMDVSEPIYRVMDVKNNELYGRKLYSLEEAKEYIKDIIIGNFEAGSTSPALCIMTEHSERLKDTQGVLFENNKILKRAEPHYYTNFYGGIYTDKLYIRNFYLSNEMSEA